MALLSKDGAEFLLRWLHFLSGITWIGLLYYFNFVQGPFFAEADAATKSVATQKLVPRALWWFRWSASLTFLTGALIIANRASQSPAGVPVMNPWSAAIFTGALLGTLMLVNVWGVIWRNQKVVIASAVAAASGGQANPAAAAAGRRAFLASRTNVVFSIPMLFFMGAASHLGWVGPLTGSTKMGMLILMVVVIVVAEYNALVGTAGPGKKMLSTLKGTFWAGFVLTAIFWIVSVILTPRM